MMAQDTQKKLKTKKHVTLFKTNLAKSLGQRHRKKGGAKMEVS